MNNESIQTITLKEKMKVLRNQESSFIELSKDEELGNYYCKRLMEVRDEIEETKEKWLYSIELDMRAEEDYYYSLAMKRPQYR